MGRNGSAWKSHQLSRRPTPEQKQHAASGHIQRTEPLVFVQNGKAEQIAIESYRPREIINIKCRFKHAGNRRRLGRLFWQFAHRVLGETGPGSPVVTSLKY